MQDLGSTHKALLLTHRHLCFSVKSGYLLGWRCGGVVTLLPVINQEFSKVEGEEKTKNALSHPPGPLHPHTQCILKTVLPGYQTWTKNPRQSPPSPSWLGLSFSPGSPYVVSLPTLGETPLPQSFISKGGASGEPHTWGFPSRRRLGLIVRGAQGCRENVTASKTEKLAAHGTAHWVSERVSPLCRFLLFATLLTVPYWWTYCNEKFS